MTKLSYDASVMLLTMPYAGKSVKASLGVCLLMGGR
jgi:hypothetical protein